MLNRREFAAGIAATTGVLSFGLPTVPAPAGIAPLPVHALRCCNDMVADNARRFARLAREVHRLEPLIGSDTRGAEQWARAYEDMADEAWGLREKGIQGYSALELELRDWIGTIFPDDATAARAPRLRLTGLSGPYRTAHDELESRLFAMARHGADDTTASRHALRAAWNITKLVPHTSDDAQAHRLAVDVLYRREFVVLQRYSA